MLKAIAASAAFLLIIATVIIVSMQASEEWTPGEVIRTPNDAFKNLPDYPFSANYIESQGYRVHYVDEGPRDGEVVLLMHGQPTWSFLYRHMIPELVDAGFRVIAPDNVGFGKSDKPLKTTDHSYQMHIDVMTDFVDQLDLQGATFFGQDWGGLIGLRVIAQRPDRFARILLSNTTLPAAPGLQGWLGYPLFRFSVWQEGNVQALEPGRFSFPRWVAYARHTDDFDFAGMLQRGTTRTLSKADLEGYAAPFPGNEYLAGVRIFPAIVASQLRQNQKVLDEFFSNWEKPLLTAFGEDDNLMAGRDKMWQSIVPGAKGQPHQIIADGNHFIQDDIPNKMSEILVSFINNN